MCKPHTSTWSTLKSLAEGVPGDRKSRLVSGVFSFPLPSGTTMYRCSRRFEREDCRHRFVLVVNLGTRGTVTVEKLALMLHSGQALLIFPFERHTFGPFEKVGISWLFIEFATENALPLLLLKQTPVKLSEQAVTVLSWFCSLHTAKTRRTPDTDRQTLFLSFVLMEMVGAAKAGMPGAGGSSAESPRYDELFGRLVHYLNFNMWLPIRIGTLAGALGVSRSHLQHVFKRHMGMSLGRYIRRYKIMHAVRLMDNTDMSLAQIGEKCGFEDLYSFSRTFKREMGVAPSVYRCRHAGKTNTP